jgi:hypothetical protein
MRIWSIHPKYLDWMGLGAQWRETLLAQKVIHGKTKGWRNHPQLNRFKEHPSPLEAVGFYLKEIQVEATRRGYNYNYSKILRPVESVEKISINDGQLEYEFKILQERLTKRNPETYLKNKGITNIIPHPLFTIRSGPPESWEKAYWREQE